MQCNHLQLSSSSSIILYKKFHPHAHQNQSFHPLLHLQEKSMFCSEVELGSFLGTIDIIPDAFSAISVTSTSYKLHATPSGINILAFNCVPDATTAQFLNRELDLVSSVNFQVVDFIKTKTNPSFFINEAAAGLFERLTVELKDLENQLIYKPLVVTGHGLGGYVAILFTLRLQHAIAIDVKEADESKGTKRPICITFGSPLIGDEALRSAILERPLWKSSFLNVVAKTDSLASVFSSRSRYKPFGTFLVCTESGGHTAFEDQESILAVLDAMESSRAGNMEVPDYGNHLKSNRVKVLYRGVSEFNPNPLRAGMTLQFREVGVLDDISNDLIGRKEKEHAKRTKSMKNAYSPNKKLNEMKISLAYMEWYMTTRRSRGGYYDCYKKANTVDEIESKQIITRYQRFLYQYWEEIVREKNQMARKEGGKLRKRWLYGGTNYRRIVEPLDIAEYYGKGNKEYIANRPDHYKLLEEWWNGEKKDLGEKRKVTSVTEDSCFWAHVEEALIWVRELKNGSNIVDNIRQKMEQDLEQFESYVMRAINSCSVSSDIFLEGSSLMEWWREYKVYKGTSYASEFSGYMNKRLYQ